jgi:hypothetical protein
MEHIGVALAIGAKVIAPPIVGVRQLVRHHQAMAAKDVAVIVGVHLQE